MEASNENFLFFFKPTKTDSTCLCGLDLKIGVIVTSVVSLLYSIEHFYEAVDEEKLIWLVWEISLSIFFLVIAFFLFMGGVFKKKPQCSIGLSLAYIFFWIEFIQFIVKATLSLLGFINPFDDKFFKVKLILYVIGESFGLIIFGYLLWVTYCFKSSL